MVNRANDVEDRLIVMLISCSKRDEHNNSI